MSQSLTAVSVNVLTSLLTSWFGHLNSKIRSKLARIFGIASKITGKPQIKLSELSNVRTGDKALSGLTNSSHLLFSQSEMPNSNQEKHLSVSLTSVPSSLSYISLSYRRICFYVPFVRSAGRALVLL